MFAASTALLVVALGGAAEPPAIAPKEFRSWFDAAEEGDLRVPKPVAAKAASYRYVFIGGFRSEAMRGYFTQNAKILRNHGVPKDAIHILASPSDQTVEEYAAEFRDDLRAIADVGPEPLVIVAHSRGACDAMAFALRDPHFVRDRVAAMFLVQAPFGGSGLADYVMGDGPPVDRSIRPLRRMVAKGVGKVEEGKVARGEDGSLAGLTREASHAYWARLRDENPEAEEVVGPRTFYIQSESRPKHLRLILKATGSYLGAHYGPNDGVVARGDQTLPGLGTSLGVYDAGHADLTQKFPASRAGNKERRGLTLAILMAMGNSPS